jgi:hypothetical protein
MKDPLDQAKARVLAAIHRHLAANHPSPDN